MPPIIKKVETRYSIQPDWKGSSRYTRLRLIAFRSIFAGRRLSFLHFHGTRLLDLASSYLLIVLTRVASRHLLVPGRMMSPRPFTADRAVGHRLERAGLLGRALINVY